MSNQSITYDPKTVFSCERREDLAVHRRSSGRYVAVAAYTANRSEFPGLLPSEKELWENQICIQ